MSVETEISTKQLLIEFISNLPDKITLAEAIEELHILAAISEGQKAASEGRFITHEEMKRRIAGWRLK